MLSGYNTDVPHADTVFHVQTEDKGLQTAWIESLIYVGGQVLARRGVSYRKRLSEGDRKKVIAELMDRQHRLMIAEIRGGKFDSKLAGLTKGGPAKGAADAADLSLPPVPPQAPPPEPDSPFLVGTAIGDVDAVPSLDQVILDYLDSEAEQEHLVLMMDADRQLKLGTSVGLSFLAKGSISGQGVAGARVTVRVISTVSEPRTVGSGRTDARGELSLHLNLPDLRRGSGALIVTATSDLGTAEIKQLL